MAMNRRAAVASKLLKQAGVTGDLMRVVESLPPETLLQYDKLLKHEEPSVGPGMNSGIVVSYKSGEVVQDRPMQGNFSEEGIAVYEAGGYVPSPKDKPRSPVGQGVYGLGDVEYRAALDPQFTDVVEDKDGNMSDDYVGLLGLRALEQKHNYDYGKFIDTDARRLDEDWTRKLGLLGGYDTETDQIRVKTTPSESQRLHALEVPDAYRALFSRDSSLPVTAHELSHAGSQRLDNPPSVGLQHKNLRLLDWERMHKTEASRNVSSVLKNYLDIADYQDEKPELDVKPSLRGVYSRSYMDMQAEAQEKYEALGPPRVKNYEDGGAVEPRSADPDAEILAIYDLLDEENQKPERERDPERIDELYSRLTELQAMSPPPVALEVSDDVYIRPQIDARGGISESNRRVPFGPDKTVQIRDRNMSGIARLGAEAGFPGFSGNDRLSGGVTGTYDRTKRLFPDEYKPFGYPSDARFGPRGFAPTGYDVRYSSGPNTFLGNVTPRQEGVSRDAPRGRSVLDLGYAYSTPEETFSVQATPFGRRVVTDPKTGDTEMDRSVMARYTSRF